MSLLGLVWFAPNRREGHALGYICVENAYELNFDVKRSNSSVF